MKLNKATIARKINAWAKLQAKLRPLLLKQHDLVTVIKAAGGGESKKWKALIVKQPKKIMIVKAHKQLRLVAKAK